MYDDRAMERNPMLPESRDTRLTYDDFVHFPDDGRRHELIDGKHYVSPSPNVRHQELVGRLHFEIETCLRRHPGTGRIFLSPLDVVFTHWDVVEPDLVFVARNQLGILTPDNIKGSPSLVVEVASRSTRRRDEQVKRRLFEREGVQEYWLVYPDRDAVTVFRRHADRSFPRVAELSRAQHDTLSTPLIPDLVLDLRDLFA